MGRGRQSISERTPTTGVVYVRVDTDHGPTLEDSALAWEKEGGSWREPGRG